MNTLALTPPLPGDDAALIALAAPRVPPDAAGLFEAEGWLRRVSGEGVALMGGACALLLEVAHPFVAAGVAEHSSYRTDPTGRLRRTLDAVGAIAFGDRAQACAAARGVEAAHARVHGVLPEGGGRHVAGAPYHGREIGAVRWVWATFAYSALAVYEHCVEPLAPADRDAYYAEHRVMARLLGVPDERLPADHAAFAHWFQETVDGDELAVTAAARDIARSILAPEPGHGMPPPGRIRRLTAGLLPERLRGAYDLPWDAREAERFEAFTASVRALRAGRRPLDAAAATR